jgi:hypothetical protein
MLLDNYDNAIFIIIIIILIISIILKLLCLNVFKCELKYRKQ